MTREEAIDYLTILGGIEGITANEAMALEIAIEALEEEPCEDCISRHAVLDLVESDWKYEGLETVIRDLPPVIPQPKTGRWILAYEQNKEDVKIDNYHFICSECQCSDIHAKDVIVPYCWKCGAKMESEG